MEEKISEKYRKIRGDILYHYTHINNFKEIKKYKKLFCLNKVNEKNIRPEFITNDLSRNLDRRIGNNKYVFLTFSTSHPFIYKQICNKSPLVEIQIDISILDHQGVLISDRVANDSNSILYTPLEALEKLKIEHCHTGRVNERIIWDEVKKYEILIPESIDLEKYFINAERVKYGY